MYADPTLAIAKASNTMSDNQQTNIISSDNQKPPIIAWAAAIAIIGFILYVYNSAQPTEITAPVQAEEVVTEPITGISDETKDAISAYFKSGSEPTIKDATWTDQSKDTLYVGVIDDKSNRDGIANYVCSVLTDDFGLSGQGVDVYVMDIAKIARDNKWVILGKAKCD